MSCILDTFRKAYSSFVNCKERSLFNLWMAYAQMLISPSILVYIQKQPQIFDFLLITMVSLSDWSNFCDHNTTDGFPFWLVDFLWSYYCGFPFWWIRWLQINNCTYVYDSTSIFVFPEFFLAIYKPGTRINLLGLIRRYNALMLASLWPDIIIIYSLFHQNLNISS